MKTTILILAALTIGCTSGAPVGTPSECPGETPQAEIVVGSDPMFREDAQAFCETLDGTLASAGRLEAVLLAFRDTATANDRGWIAETTRIEGRTSRYTIGWNGFVTPTIDALTLALPICVVP